MQAATKITERSASGASGEPVTILSFKGDIASTSKSVILDAYHGLGIGVHKLLLDFQGVEYINSSGIAIVIQMLLEASKSGQHVIGLFGLSAHFVKVFTMVGVAKYAVIAADEATALAAL